MTAFRRLSAVKKILKGVLPAPVFAILEKIAVLLVFKSNITTLCPRIVKSLKFRSFSSHIITRIFTRHFYPETLAIFLTTRCNIRCMICRRENHYGEDLEFDNLRKLEMPIRYATIIDLTGWGECLLYPKFEEVLAYIFSLNGKRRVIQITSNGTLLCEKVAALLRGRLYAFNISLNAATAETYNRDMQYGDFGITFANIRRFVFALDDGDRARVTLHFVAHADNYQEIPQFVQLAATLGVGGVSIGPYLVGTEEHIHKALFNLKDLYNESVVRAEELAQQLCVTLTARKFYCEGGIPPQKCTDPYTTCLITPNGEIASPCCYAGYYSMGNVYKKSFEEVWFGEKYVKLRRKRHLKACEQCTPFVTFDDLCAHFDGHFKQQPKFNAILDRLGEEGGMR